MKHYMNGTLTAENSHHYLSHRFNVPQGATRLDIDFQYAPNRVGNFGNLLTLSLCAAEGHEFDLFRVAALTVEGGGTVSARKFNDEPEVLSTFAQSTLFPG